MSESMSTQPTPNEEALIDAALAALEQASPPPTPLFDSGREPAPEQTPVEAAMRAAATVTSPTLDALDASRRPKAATVCETCPNSVWFASPTELKCYCRVMFLVTWSSTAPHEITHCDGAFLGQDG